MTTESNIQKQIMLAISEAGGRVWRNNVGVLKDKRGIPIRFGLCPGSSDLIGVCPDGKMLAIEVKKPGQKPREDQQKFIDLINSMGGKAGVATSAKEAVDIMRG